MADEIIVPAAYDPKARIRVLSNYGGQVEVDFEVPPRRYFRSGLEMLRMANCYLDDGNFESAFILYSKFITLFVERLPKHPEYKSSLATERQVNKKKLAFVFGIAEEIKKKLNKQYEEDERKWKEQEKKRLEELAREEARQAEELRKKREEEALLEAEELQRRRDEEERQRLQQEQEYLNLQEEERKKLAERERAQSALGGLSIGAAALPPGGQEVLPPSYDSLPPSVAGSVSPSVPSRELKPSVPPLPGSPTDNGQPMVDRSLKPVDHFTSTGGDTGNPYGLRTLYIPAELMLRFINLALPNTQRSTETLGLLCGTMSQGSFRITHLVIPKQTGTPDSCDMMGEEEVFEVQDKYDLLTLGWIHTHPTQTAFLSSVDMHEHCGYQKLLPEAVAIVCSPKYNETGFFFLTPNYGLGIIGNCPQRGFHPHQKEPPLFEECPHVKVDSSLRVTVLDLRK